MAYASQIEFSSVEDLEGAIRGVGPGEAIRLKFVGPCPLEEAAAIYRILKDEELIKESMVVDAASKELLRQAACHYDQLDALQSCFELAAHDIKHKVALKADLFKAVRTAANTIATTTDTRTALQLLDDVVIDAQRLGRLCCGLEFGEDGVDVATLTEEDLLWLMSDGAGPLVISVNGGDVLQGIDGAELPPNLDDGAVVLVGNLNGAEALAGGNVHAGVGGKEGELLADPTLLLGPELKQKLGGDRGVVDASGQFPNLDDVAMVLSGNVDGAETLAGGNVHAGVGGKEGELLAEPPLLLGPELKEKLSADHGGRDDAGRPRSWVELKEKTVVALIEIKLHKLLEAISSAKGRRVVNP